MRLSFYEFWLLTWRELDALASAWRKRERRLDVRNALIRHTMASLWAKDPPAFEDLLPPDEDAVKEPINPDEKLMLKLNTVITTAGGGIAASEPQQAPELDAFREKMWRLMGVKT